jgi:hypothetical protein
VRNKEQSDENSQPNSHSWQRHHFTCGGSRAEKISPPDCAWKTCAFVVIAMLGEKLVLSVPRHFLESGRSQLIRK